MEFLIAIIAAVLILGIIGAERLYRKQEQLIKVLKSLPVLLGEQISKSLQGSVNNQKGALAEHIAYLRLGAQYDRLIPLASVCDFLAVKFTTEGQEGFISFIDIKSGNSAKLSVDQRKVKDLVMNQKVKFETIRINTDANTNPENS